MAGLNSDTKLLLHFNDSNGATSTSDESDSNHTVTFTGSSYPVISTSVKKFGAASCSFGREANSYLVLDDSADWDIGGSNSDSWTIDMQIYFNDDPVVDIEYIIVQREDANNRWFMYRDTDGTITFYLRISGVNEIALISTTATQSGQFYHIAICKVASEWGLYIDGSQEAYDSTSATGTFSDYLYIGNNKPSFDTVPLDAYLDELRIQKSNYFNAAPNSTPDDTISVPTAEYSRIKTANQAVIIA